MLDYLAYLTAQREVGDLATSALPGAPIRPDPVAPATPGRRLRRRAAQVGLAAGWLVVAMWGWAGMFLGILVRGTSLAIGLGLVWTLAVENLVRGFASLLAAIDTLQRWLPGTNAGSLVAAVGVPEQGASGGTPGVTATVDGTQATLLLAAYLVAFTVAAGSAAPAARRHLTARSEGGQQ